MCRKLVLIMPRYVFGPVPSRRLGNSLGINNIPYKICSYSCVYCQLGKTLVLSVERKAYSDANSILKELSEIVGKVDIDYITFVPDGEPTLDSNIGLTASRIKDEFSIPLAILTNASLLWMDSVREDLLVFDTVSVKIDAVSIDVWKRINRPHGTLSLERVLVGVSEFASEFNGRLISETMLVRSINTKPSELRRIAGFIKELRIDRAYLSIPIRPPAEDWVESPTEEELLIAFETFANELGSKVELLNMPEPERFQVSSQPVEYILDVIRVHPLRLEYAIRILEEEYDNPMRIIDELETKGIIKIVEYQGTRYMIRKYVIKSRE